MRDRSRHSPLTLRTFLPLLAVACLLAFAFQGSRGLWEADEGRYTVVALNMLRGGDWLLPRLNHETIHVTKPPLTYWAIAGSMAIFGKREWAARLPNALAFLIVILLVREMGIRLGCRRRFPPALIYGTMLLPFAAAGVVTTDTLLTLWETVAVLGFVKSQWGVPAGEERRRALLLMWSGFGLAFLTKGPPGLIALLPILCFLALTDGWRAALRIVTLPGLAVFAIFGLSWYAIVILQHGNLLGYFVKNEVVGRIFTGMHHRNDEWYGGFAVYAPTLLLGTLPWGLALLYRPWTEWRRRRHWRAREFRRRHAEDLFLMLWILLPLAIFFCARSRLLFYVLPLFVPISLLVARRLPRHWPPATPRMAVALAIWALFIIGARGAVSRLTSDHDDRSYAAELRSQIPFPVQEVVFVDQQPRYGVSFYLGCEVEGVEFRRLDRIEEETPPGEYGTIKEELEEQESGQIFVVEANDVDKFARALKPLGIVPQAAGKYRDSRFFLLPGA